MKNKLINNENCITSYAQCIQWNLGDIPSLGIVNGDFLDEIVYAIANKLCDLLNPLDLSSVSVQCLIDKLNAVEPNPKTIQTVLQLVIDNECKLKDLIDNLQDQINNSNPTLNLNLKCLAQFDSFGNPLPYNEQTVLQSLIDELCVLKATVAYLGGKVIDLQNQIDNLNITPYQLPTVSTCISSGKRLDLSSSDIATSLCNLRAATGTEVQLQSAIAQQCANFNSQFGTIVGWNVAPINLAQSYSNLEIAFCNVLNRLISIEQTCCAPSCDKIKIGFTVDIDYDLSELSLNFTSGAGTFIPTNFVDCGSIITITDELGNIVTPTNTLIVQNGTISGISFFSLTGKIFTISIKTRFCLKDDNNTVILVCQDCISKTINVEQGCPVCQVCVTGKTGYVEITYLLNNQYTAVRILPNQCNYVPTTGTVIAIERTGDAVEDSDCLDLSNLEEKKCYQFMWSVTSNSNGTTDAWEDSNSSNRITAINVGGSVYNCDISISDPNGLKDFINTNINSAIVNQVSAVYFNATSSMKQATVLFKSFPSIANNMYLSFSISNAANLRGYPEEISCSNNQ